MSIFNGTSGSDEILRTGLSAGIVTDPAGLTGTLTGEANLIYGNGGNDLIEAGDGDGYYGDTVYGGTGSDTITGGAGYDFLYGDVGNDVLTASDIGSDVGDDLDGGAGKDTLTGGLGPNYLSGGDGADLIRGGSLGGEFDLYDGGAGNDVIYAADNVWNEIYGGTGADEMHGGTGADFYYVDDAGDRVIERANAGYDSIGSSLATMTLAKNVEGLYFDFGLGAIRATGNGLGNDIQTADSNDTVNGGGGDDAIYAYSGDDRICGEAGNDYLAGSFGLDTVRGGTGSDTLVGGYDADRLYGGKGHDVFVFYEVTDSTPTRRDVIAAGDGAPAFEGAGKAAGDLIDVSAIDADSTDDLWTTFVFGGTGKGHLSVVNSGTDSLVRGNVDDDWGFEFQVLIRDGAVNASAYTAADFLLAYV